MSDNTIRVGFVGAGANTKERHIPGFQRLEGVELVSVSNRSLESSQRVADEFKIPKVYDNWAELIAAPDTNAICIGTWPYMHHPLVLVALDYDKHVLTEARMAMNAAQAHEMLDASREKPALVAQVVPFAELLTLEQAIKALMADGYLGELLTADLVFVVPWAPEGGFIDRDGPYKWRFDRDFSGYNMMLMGACYESLMRLVGPASSVTALTRVFGNTRTDDAGNRRFVDVPDHAEVLCEMVSGPLVHMRFSDVTGLTQSRLWLYGTDGTLSGDLHTNRLWGGRRGDSELSEIEIPPAKHVGWRVEEEFVNAIRGLEPVTLTTFEDGVRYMEFTEAVTLSAQSGETVHLPL